MALLNGQNVCDTVAFRINNRIAANGTGAGSIIECCNLALGLISSAASWEWDQKIVGNMTVTSDSATLTGADPGKEMSFFNILTAPGTRIERVKNSDTFSASTGFINTQNTNAYNTYQLAVDTLGGTYDPIVTFYPNGKVGLVSVNAIYHLTPPVLVYGASPTVRWTVKAMDMLLIDFTEAYVKKVLGMAGWDITWSDCIKRISEFKTTYSSQRENTGPESETEDSSKEKMMGRD